MSRRLHTLVLPSSFAALVFALHLGEAKAACAISEPKCSAGPAAGLKGQRAEGPEDSVVGFDWQPFSGNFQVGVSAGLKLVPKDPDPFFSVDMSTGAKPPMVQAAWGTDKIIKLTFLDSPTAEASFNARYGLAVQVRLYGKALGASFDKTWDVTDKITGLGNTDFKFEAKNSMKFKPWGTATPAEMIVAGGSIDTTSLFNVTLEQVGLDINCGSYKCATGNLGLFISTEETLFRYRTVAARLNGASVDATQEMPLPTQPEYGDELAVKASFTGGVNIDGHLYAKPYLRLTSIYGYGPGGTRSDNGGVSWPLEYAAASTSIHQQFKLPTDTTKSITFDYPETTVLIPIPNVKLAKDALTMTAKTGRVTINNTGKKEARVSFATQSPGFSVPGGEQVIDAGGTYELQITYTNNDSATGDIIVTTSDPDSPTLNLKVGANGASVGDPDLGDDGDDGLSSGGRGADGLGETADAGGCGCTTTSGAGQTAGFATLFGSVLAAMAFLRRRARN